jgi:PHD/YefM family antitoxin component YafN of YafNO toxin-antitoxin module
VAGLTVLDASVLLAHFDDTDPHSEAAQIRRSSPTPRNWPPAHSRWRKCSWALHVRAGSTSNSPRSPISQSARSQSSAALAPCSRGCEPRPAYGCLERTRRPALVTRHGKPVAVLSPIDMDALEDFILANAPEYVASMAEADEDAREGRTRPLADIVAELDTADTA